MAETTPITFTPAARTVGDARRAERIDIEAMERRNKLALQLSALTSILCGEGGVAFRDYSAEIQDNVLWLVADMAQEVADLSHGKEGA